MPIQVLQSDFTLSKIVVGGLKLDGTPADDSFVSIDDDGFAHADFRITWNRSERPSELAFLLAVKGDLPLPNIIRQQIRVYANGSALVFGGYVNQIDSVLLRNGIMYYNVRCVDWSDKLNFARVAPHESTGRRAYSGDSDGVIVVDLIHGEALLQPVLDGITASTAAGGYVENVIAHMGAWEVDIGTTLGESLRRLCEITNAEWYVDADQKLHYFEPRLHFAPVDLSTVLEVSNLLLRTEQFDNATWVKTGVTATADTVISTPLIAERGQSDTLVCDGQGGPFHAAQTFSLESAGALTASFYVIGKTGTPYNGTGACYIEITDSAGVTTTGEFNLATGVGTTPGSTNSVFIESAIPAPGGPPWYRIGLHVAAVAAGNVTVRLGIGKYVSGTFSKTFASANTDTLYVVGAQATYGVSGPTPYRAAAGTQRQILPLSVHSWTEDASELVNRVVIDYGGSDSVSVDDTASQGDYGIWMETVVNRDIQLESTARLLGAAELARKSRPRIRADVSTTANSILTSLRPGQEILLHNPPRNVSWQAAHIESLSLTFKGNLKQLTMDLGPPVRDLKRLRKQLEYVLEDEKKNRIPGAGSVRTATVFTCASTPPTDDPVVTRNTDGTLNLPSGFYENLEDMPTCTDTIYIKGVRITPE